MVEIVTHVTSSGVPLTTPVDLPAITIRRIDTGAVVAGPSAMTEVGDGAYRFSFSESATLEYSVMVDADPSVTGQVEPEERYHFGAFSGISIARLETDVPAILVDTSTLIDALVGHSFTAAAGGSTTEIRTNATQANDFFNGSVVVIRNAAGAVARVARAYANTNGAFSVAPLPFTPSAADPVYVLNASMLEVEQIRKVTTNRVVVNGTDTQMDVYEDDDTTVAFSFTISSDRRDRTPL